MLPSFIGALRASILNNPFRGVVVFFAAALTKAVAGGAKLPRK